MLEIEDGHLVINSKDKNFSIKGNTVNIDGKKIRLND